MKYRYKGNLVNKACLRLVKLDPLYLSFCWRLPHFEYLLDFCARPSNSCGSICCKKTRWDTSFDSEYAGTWLEIIPSSGHYFFAPPWTLLQSMTEKLGSLSYNAVNPWASAEFLLRATLRSVTRSGVKFSSSTRILKIGGNRGPSSRKKEKRHTLYQNVLISVGEVTVGRFVPKCEDKHYWSRFQVLFIFLNDKDIVVQTDEWKKGRKREWGMRNETLMSSPKERIFKVKT